MEKMENVLRGASAKAPFWTPLAVIAALGFWGCGTDHEDEEATVRIETPANGSTVAGPKVLLRVSTTHFTYGGAAAGKLSAAGRTAAAQHGGVTGGHIHVFLDRPAGLDANTVTDLTKSDTTTLSIPTAGEHYIIVAGADADHNDVESMLDSVKFTVTIP
ncbi:MAG TPA: hypothetical protein VJ385_23085 [Fibrobacteria bacterium]|nr:hypothetical protein [Fibrobacteria bacterium]